jgi:PAS domain S-box-containing protein
MLRWLRPPQIDDEYERVAYHSLHYTLLLAIGLVLIAGFPPRNPTQAIIGLTGYGVIIVSYVLLHKRRLYLAGGLFLGSGWVLNTLNLFNTNGINNAAVFVYAIFIIFANIVFPDRRFVISFTLLSILSCLVLTIGEQQGVLPLESTPESAITVNRLIISTFVFSAVGILSSFASTTLRHSLAHLRENGEALQARNRELETLTRSLTASEERYRLLFEHASVVALVYDSEGRVIIANPAAAAAYGRTQEQLEGQTVHEILLPQQADRVVQMNQKALETGEVAIFEGSGTLPNGKMIYFLRHVIPLPRPTSPLAGHDKPQVLALTTDLTEGKRNLERQQELQAAQEKIVFYTNFFSTVSHDIKTPLSVIEVSLHLLERADNTPYQLDKITRIREQVRLLGQYIQDMLMIARLEQLPTLNKQPVDIKSMIASIIQVLNPVFEKKGIQCDVQGADEEFIISADKDQIRRALINLVENAINYTPPGGQIRIALSRENGLVSVNVSDTGIGIPPEDMPYIFDAFFRAPEAKASVSTGSGLGLTMVKKIAELHGGSISVTSQLHQGSSFLLTLPAKTG